MLAQSHAPTASPSRIPSTSTRPTAAAYFATQRSIRDSARLTSTQRLTLLAILSHADNATSEAAVGIPRLAAETGFTTRTIERTVAALVACGWLVRHSAASAWGTNIYRVTPRPDDVRPPRTRRRRPQYGRPFAEQKEGHAEHAEQELHEEHAEQKEAPQGHAEHAEQELHEAPDTGSVPSPTPDRVEALQTPDTGSASLSCESSPVDALPAPEPTVELDAVPPTHTGVSDVAQKHEVAGMATLGAAVQAVVQTAAQVSPEDEPIISALRAHPELATIARPAVASLLAAEHRPTPVVRRALGELASHARDAAAIGAPFSTATLVRKARRYVRLAFAEARSPKPQPVAAVEPRPTPTSTPRAPQPPAPPIHETAEHLRGLLAALGVKRQV